MEGGRKLTKGEEGVNRENKGVSERGRGRELIKGEKVEIRENKKRVIEGGSRKRIDVFISVF